MKIEKLIMVERAIRDDIRPVSEKEQNLTSQLMHIAISIHRILGPGLMESIYEKCFCFELTKRKIPFSRNQQFPVNYGDLVLDKGIHIDLLIDDLIVIELKAEQYHPLWEMQMLSFLKITGKRLGYVMNFHSPLMKDGIKRLSL